MLSISGGLFEKLNFTQQIESFSKIMSKIPKFDTIKINFFDSINDSKSKYPHKYVPKSVQNDSKSAQNAKLGDHKY